MYNSNFPFTLCFMFKDKSDFEHSPESVPGPWTACLSQAACQTVTGSHRLRCRVSQSKLSAAWPHSLHRDL